MRLSWPNIVGFGDQAVSSLANILIIFACARVMSINDFGEFSVGVAVTTATVVGSRGFLGTAMAVISGNDERVRLELRLAAGAALSAGSVVGAILFAYGVWHESALWMVLGIGTPFLVWHDVLRYGAISLQCTNAAFISDTVRLCISAVAFGLTIVKENASGLTLVILWPLGAVIAGIAASVMLKSAPDPLGLFRLVRDRLGERLAYGFETCISSVAAIGYILVLTAQIGSEGVAGLRGAGTFLGPLNTMVAGLSLVMVPQLARNNSSIAGMVRTVAPLTALMCLTAAVCGSFGIWLPEAVGGAILGATWVAAAAVLPIMGIEYAVNAINASLLAIVKARRAAARVVLIRALHTVGIMCVALLAPQFGGPQAVAIGLVVNSLLGLVVACAVLLGVKGSPS